ncbi:MAG: hypothetical protein DHS20C01_11000 [marine bacterium B5-7]|nr:MAG: hypothetical protein DHS20C01_11000 [marine bacterium B5-7]
MSVDTLIELANGDTPVPGEGESIRIEAGPLRLREFRIADTKALFDIRNHHSVRSGMRDASEITMDAHQRYVEEVILKSRDQWLFIVSNDGVDVGIALLRDIVANTAEIGIMVIDPPHHRREAYFASQMICRFAFDKLGLERLISKVPQGNDSALAYNLKSGFVIERPADDTYHYLLLEVGRYYAHPTHRRFHQRWPVRIGRAR